MPSPQVHDESHNHVETQHSATWLVKNFSKLLNVPVGTKIVSPPFAIENFVFEFWLCPEGFCKFKTLYDGRYMCVLLKLREPDSALIEFTVEIGHDTIKTFKSIKQQELFESEPKKSACGDKKLVDYKIFVDEVLKLSNDEVMVRCSIYGLDTPESCLRLKIFDKNERFFNSEKLSDVKIIVGDKTINAHKIILSSQSDVFAAMLEHHMVENDQGVINIDDIDYDVMLEIVRFMYVGRVERIVNKMKELLVAADKYALAELVILCGKCMCLNLTPGNVLEYANFAHTHRVDELEKAAISFFTLHGKEVVATTNFRESVKHVDVDVMVELLKNLVEK
ncbi:hypothetical protein QAD02_001124 [Eretmocerus hayati]|uniref:Uncharacterized protein n=1 Tax=Eretmocerus hayati TaxID=131215 RepID=A0ACC2NFB0_9HYME|nr:hypothetical protein QAD02_001124 [Eretmocerus hayati]